MKIPTPDEIRALRAAGREARVHDFLARLDAEGHAPREAGSVVSAEYERGVTAMREAAAAACVSLATERVGRGNCADCNDALACAERIRGLDAPHDDDRDCTPDYLDPETR